MVINFSDFKTYPFLSMENGSTRHGLERLNWSFKSFSLQLTTKVQCSDKGIPIRIKIIFMAPNGIQTVPYLYFKIQIKFCLFHNTFPNHCSLQDSLFFFKLPDHFLCTWLTLDIYFSLLYDYWTLHAWTP